MDTGKFKETLQAELDRLSHLREELRLQASLAKADTRSELNRLDSVWQRVQEELRRFGEHAKVPATELGLAARSLLDELSHGYGRIKREFEDSGLSNVTQRLSALTDASAQRDPANLQGLGQEVERAALDDAPFMRMLERIGGQIGAHADARAVFANPVSKDGVTVIPVARVFGGYGAGSSQLSGPAAAGAGGGGFGAQPVGFIEIDRHGARFRRIDTPVESWFGIAMTALDVARRAGGWAFATYKRRR
jgi:uncharacterized spore protein YtfJ